jgi:hypothetical protein
LIGDRRECPLPQELCSPLRFVLQARAKSCYNNAQPPVRRVSSGRPEKQKLHGTNMAPATAAGVGRRHMDLVTIAVVGVIVISYLVGALTSSVETEEKLPHRY